MKEQLTWAQQSFNEGLKRHGKKDRRNTLALSLAGASLLLSGATLFVASEDLQKTQQNTQDIQTESTCRTSPKVIGVEEPI